MQGMTGEIRCFMGCDPPTGWAFCKGQSLGKVTHGLLFRELGFRFGKVDEAHFKLPTLENPGRAERVAFVMCLGGFDPRAEIPLRVGEICLFAGASRPNGRILCDGTSLEINEYSPLFSVIGHQFGGEDPLFQLPNLSDKVPHPLMSFYINFKGEIPE